ncbi:MAG: thioredoxin-disulfide reductase [Chloroflexi bacterium]|nr:thioredoxin-disulfide reductase [Chloroflexota bacterium]
MKSEYQVIIIGGGPAGLTAGLYAARDRLDTLLVERGIFGGQIATAELVENFPCFPDGLSGMELGERLHQQASKFGLKTLTADVTGLELQGKQKVVKTSEGDFRAEAVIIASGAERRKLGIPGEKEFTGKGVSYCATCDGCFFQDKPVVVVGGGNAAISEALHLTKFASKVTLIHRRDQLRATRVVAEQAQAEPKIEFLWSTVIDEIAGDDFVRELKLHHLPTGRKSALEVAGVFVAVGLDPNTGYLKGVLPLDENGAIITNEKMETAIPGVYAAGDIRRYSGMQAITAAGDGATAAMNAGKYLAH